MGDKRYGEKRRKIINATDFSSSLDFSNIDLKRYHSSHFLDLAAEVFDLWIVPTHL